MRNAAKRPHFIRLSFFVWLILPVIGFAVWQVAGLPAIVWSYSFLDNGSPYDPYRDRTYISCTYIGPYGARTVPSISGDCPTIRFFKEDR